MGLSFLFVLSIKKGSAELTTLPDRIITLNKNTDTATEQICNCFIFRSSKHDLITLSDRPTVKQDRIHGNFLSLADPDTLVLIKHIQLQKVFQSNTLPLILCNFKFILYCIDTFI